MSVHSTRAEGRRLIEVAALTTLAVAQPVLNTFGQNPETFIFLDQSRSAEIIRFALIVLVGPALILWSMGLVIGLLGGSARQIVHAVTLGTLVGLLAIVFTKRVTSIGGLLLAAIGVVGAGAFVAAYRRWAGVRSWVFAAGLSLPLVGLAFVLTSPTAKLVWGADDAPVADIEVTSDTPIVMLVLDEFPTVTLLDDKAAIDAVRYPNFARLADESLWLRNATTNAGFTQLAVPAMLTGQMPSLDRDPIWTDHPENLFNLLGGSYALHVAESLTQLCAPSVCDGETPPGAGAEAKTLWPLLEEAVAVYRSQLSLGGDRYDPSVAFGEATTTATTTLPPPMRPSEGRAEGLDFNAALTRTELLSQPTRYEDFLDQIDDYGDRTMHFLHLVLPHRPWKFFADGTSFDPPDVLTVGSSDTQSQRWGNEWLTAVNRQTHVLQTQYLDSLLGRFLDRLEDIGLYDDALLIVAADHGAGFTDGEPLRILTPENATEVAWIPMFVKEPGRTEGEVSDVNVESVDVAPTITDILGVDPPWPVEGRSVFAPPRGARPNKTFVQRASAVNPDPDVLITPGAFTRGALVDRAMPALADGDLSTAGLYAGRPFADTLGRLTAVLDVEPSAGVVVRLDGVEAFAQVDTAGPLPAYVTGTVEGSAQGDVFAFSLNGRIAGLSPVTSWGNRTAMIATILPRTLFVDGANDLEVLRFHRRDDGNVAAEPVVLEPA